MIWLFPYVPQEIQAFARSMKRRKVNSPIKDYANIQELTPEILDAIIVRIEISHVKYRSKPGSVIHIYWKLKKKMRADPKTGICPLLICFVGVLVA